MPPQALLPVPLSATFHLCHIPLAGCKNALCLVSGVSFLTYRSVTPRSSLLVNRGEPHIDHLKIKTPQCLQTNRNTPMLSSASSGRYTPPYSPSTLPPNLPKPIHCMNDCDWCFRSRCYWVKALTKPSVNWRPSVGNFSAGWWFGTLA